MEQLDHKNLRHLDTKGKNMYLNNVTILFLVCTHACFWYIPPRFV